MRGSSHLAIGVLTGLGLPILFHQVPLSATGVFLSAFSSLAPDVDEPHSILSKNLSLAPVFERIIPPASMMRMIMVVIGGFLLACGTLYLHQLHQDILVLLFSIGAAYLLLAFLCGDHKIHQLGFMLIGGTLFLTGHTYTKGTLMLSGLIVMVLGTIFQAEKMRTIFLSAGGGAFAFFGFTLSMWWLVALGIFFAITPWLPHRGATHTIWAAALWGYICYGMEGYFHTPGLLWMGVAGYLSHLIADSITVERVKWFSPLSHRSLGLPIIRVGSDHGNQVEKLIIIGFSIIVIVEYATKIGPLLS
ncbi:metal-dependent hydrolase [Aneurinibacillus terranovensis]|uniref:metal-dependent hydrolase n=1 Tax=Aneurinibacillus terranovensis TaxID=278991 RepID=UPI0003F60F01|nr:metal-dependent hydrolase [Aneurinibacillus terranovensis]